MHLQIFLGLKAQNGRNSFLPQQGKVFWPLEIGAKQNVFTNDRIIELLEAASLQNWDIAVKRQHF